MAKLGVLLEANKGGGGLEMFLRWGNRKNLKYLRTVPNNYHNRQRKSEKHRAKRKLLK